MRNLRLWAAVVSVGLFGGCARPSQAVPVGPKTPPKPGYAALVKDAATQEGFFLQHRKKDDLFWEIPADRLGKAFFLKLSIEEGFGLPAALTGQPLGGIDIVAFEKIDDERIHLVSRNVEYTAEEGSPLRKAVAKGFPDSLLAALKIEAVNPKTKALLVNMKPFLLSDAAGMLERINKAAGKETPYTFNAAGSYIKEVKGFPENVEVLSSFHFVGKKPGPFRTVPDPRSLSVGVNYSFSMIPERSGYRPRAYDDRVGFFRVSVRDFAANDPKSPDRHHIIRWNLEKQDPAAAMSPPVKPIRFWIDNATPKEYREAVRRGILAWNRAFEAIGFTGAVEACQMPDDAAWDPSDVRYSVVRWITARECPFGGLGPARVHPATGEILDADILINGEIARSIRNKYRLGVAPLREGSEELDPAGQCDHAESLSAEALFALDALAARGDVSPFDPAPPEFVEAYIQDVVCHEVGHVLGLRHNFRGSFLNPIEKIHDKEWTSKNGLSGSVMEYDPVNIAPKGKPQGFFFSPGIGPCDVWAVSYGYGVFPGKAPAEEAAELARLAARCGEPAHAFATDEDADQSDPTVARFDFTSDPLSFCQQQMAVAREVIASAETFHRPGEPYADFRDLVGRYLGVHQGAIPIIARHVAGQKIYRIHAGDMPGVLPVSPIEPAVARRALAILADEIFSDEPFRFAPELLAKLAPDRMNGADKLDYFLHPRVVALRLAALEALTGGDFLRRIQESSLRLAAEARPLTLPEFFDWMTATVWRELSAAEPSISPARQEVQANHVERLAAMIAPTAPTMKNLAQFAEELVAPDEAAALAWQELGEISEEIAKRLAGQTLDPSARAHLGRMRARIDGVLAAFARGEK